MIETEALRQQVADLQARVAQLEAQVAAILPVIEALGEMRRRSESQNADSLAAMKENLRRGPF